MRVKGRIITNRKNSHRFFKRCPPWVPCQIEWAVSFRSISPGVPSLVVALRSSSVLLVFRHGWRFARAGDPRNRIDGF